MRCCSAGFGAHRAAQGGSLLLAGDIVAPAAAADSRVVAGYIIAPAAAAYRSCSFRLGGSRVVGVRLVRGRVTKNGG